MANGVYAQDGSYRVTVEGFSIDTDALATELTLVALLAAFNAATVDTVADGELDSGDPDLTASHSLSTLTGALQTTAYRSYIVSDLDRAGVSRHFIRGDATSGTANNTDGASTSCIASAGSNIGTALTHISLFNTSASAVLVDIKDGTTVKMTGLIPAGSGWSPTLLTPLIGTAATAWNFDPASATTTIYCNMIGYKMRVS